MIKQRELNEREKRERREKMNKNTNMKIYIIGYKVKREWEKMNKRID